MHDIKEIAKDPAAFDRAMARRRLSPRAGYLLEEHKQWRDFITEAEEHKKNGNKLADDIAKKIREGKTDDIANYTRAAKGTKRLASEAERDARAKQDELKNDLWGLPNIAAADVPDGKDESANKELRKEGKPREFTFEPKWHDTIGEGLNAMDFPRAAKVAGARFAILYDQLARLERALASFMLDIHTREFGYREVMLPILVRKETLYGSGHLPKFDNDLFKTSDGKYMEIREGFWKMTGKYEKVNSTLSRYLIPTAETVLTGLHGDEILAEEQLPLRYVAWTNCFRAEAGAAGRDTRGLLRLHQFSKVELVSYTTPESSEGEHERMTACAEEILKRLGLPYRVMLLCCGDMGFSAEKTYDLEVWMPAQKLYREISSCSNCGAFQSRRLKARFKRKGEQGTLFPHALNGSGLAVGRTMAALLENYQEEDGSVTLPECLGGYMGGELKISNS